MKKDCRLRPMAQRIRRNKGRVEPRFSDVSGEWVNLLVISRAQYLKNQDITHSRGNDQNFRYIEE